MIERSAGAQPGAQEASRWPRRRRAAWTALFIAVLSWSAILQPSPPSETLPQLGTVEA
jgi:hypothetical protein